MRRKVGVGGEERKEEEEEEEEEEEKEKDISANAGDGMLKREDKMIYTFSFALLQDSGQVLR